MTIVRGRDIGTQDNETSPRSRSSTKLSRVTTGDKKIRSAGVSIAERTMAAKSRSSASSKTRKPRASRNKHRALSTFRFCKIRARGARRLFRFVPPAIRSIVAAIRSEVQSIEPNLPVFRVKTLEQQVDATLGQERQRSPVCLEFSLCCWPAPACTECCLTPSAGARGDRRAHGSARNAATCWHLSCGRACRSRSSASPPV